MPCRRFEDFEYRTRKSWSRVRRVVGKAEILDKGQNPRFVVTNLPAEGLPGEPQERFAAPALYEKLLRARRNGKPHQGGAAGPFCRSHQHELDGFQPTPAVVLGFRPSHGLGVAG